PAVQPAGSTNGKDTDTAGGSLVLLPSGGAVRSQSGSLSQRLGPLLKQLRGRADFVIIDTPPALLTVEMAELSRLIDDVLVVDRPAEGRGHPRSHRRHRGRPRPRALRGAEARAARPLAAARGRAPPRPVSRERRRRPRRRLGAGLPADSGAAPPPDRGAHAPQ